MLQLQQTVFLTNNVQRALDDVARLCDFNKKADAYAKAYVTELHNRANDVPLYSALLDKFTDSLKEIMDGGLPRHMLESCLRQHFPDSFLSSNRTPAIESCQYSGLAR
jgi:hypothetical protein